MNLKFSSLGAVLALILGAAVAFGVSSSTLLSLLTQSIIYAVFALGVGVLLKQNGMVSFGHALFFGGASYLVGILLQLQIVSAELAILVALLGVTVAAFLIGLVIVRVPGVAFGMLTLAIGQMFFLTASRARGLTGGADGMNIDWPSRLFGFPMSQMLKPATMFLICWTTLVVVMFLLAWLMRTRFGAITEAVRDNEERARFIGITTLLPRAAVYALSALVTSVAGVLSALNTGFVSPESLHWSLSGVALMMVVVGGFKALWGPAVGAVVYFMFKDILGEHATHWMTIFGMALITVIVFSPTGVAGLFDRWVLGKKPSVKVGGH
ncbi:branched-chain amino acid ABC transporter permease [Limnohabitans lacus]|uniref:Branched-chain amino acid ABC transporter permease n=1 Tax=Limnohabitans lacus TaxID=3045173 RepID=A0ABT6X590_9BURK|nr:branched-chain amino acid ABC transporter permease [Limnohabitans sp. HM2-2]MDI9233262.1 branched-chain amino acid ABC transporter permease [Limnohabitans sp. HM2-2]